LRFLLVDSDFVCVCVGILFVCGGGFLVWNGYPFGWLSVAFWGTGVLFFLYDKVGVKEPNVKPYKVEISQDEIASDYQNRRIGSVTWTEIERVWYVTTSDGPIIPDEWIVFEGCQSPCWVSTEATGFDELWKLLDSRFPGFDFKPIALGGTEDAKYLCWSKATTAS
jgi:hypothetical protein